MDAICCICEYPEPVILSDFMDKISASVVFGNTDISIYGYTIIDSAKAIIELLPDQFQKIYGRSTARALIFTGVTSGKSSMVAVRVTNLKPGAIVLQGLNATDVDPVAVRIAEIENIPLLTTPISSEEITTVLNKR
jgi:putative transcriptional regulator